MAKVMLIGAREYEMKTDDGQRLQGISVYYANPLSSQDGLYVSGYASEKLSIRKDTEMYHKIRGLDLSEPVAVTPVFDLVPGRKQPILVDILFDDDEMSADKSATKVADKVAAKATA